MKRIAPACLLLLAGCTSAPVADLMDWLSPGRLDPAPGYHGGEGQQTIGTPSFGRKSSPYCAQVG